MADADETMATKISAPVSLPSSSSDVWKSWNNLSTTARIYSLEKTFHFH